MDLKPTIRAIADYPKPGIIFRDVTTLMGDPKAFAHVVTLLAEAHKGQDIQKIAGIEARGFVFGAALADRLGLGFIPVRKLGKLPAETYKQSYKLEYGEDSLEIHQDAVEAGEKVLIIDDLLATGGTVGAAAKLLHHVKADLVGAAFVVELPELGGREHLTSMGIDVLSLIEFEGH